MPAGMATGSVRRSASSLRVLVHDPYRASLWSLGEVLEWRWTDKSVGAWEALVECGTEEESAWVPGDRLRKVND